MNYNNVDRLQPTKSNSTQFSLVSWYTQAYNQKRQYIQYNNLNFEFSVLYINKFKICIEYKNQKKSNNLLI